MKLVQRLYFMNKLFLLFGNKYRNTQLNSCLRFFKNKNFFIISVSSKIIFYLINFFFKKKIIYIFLDGNELNKKFNFNYNLWFNTQNELPKDRLKNSRDLFLCRDLKNENIVMPLTPIFNHKRDYTISLNKNTKIVYISEVDINVNEVVKNFWNKNKENILNDLKLINDQDYIKEVFFEGNEDGYNNYMKLKNLLRFELINTVHRFFKNNLLLVGKDWIKLGYSSKKVEYNTSFRKKIYKNNICLDFGSKSGTNSLYPRSVEILENNGFLLQAEQNDTSILNNSMINNFDNFKSKNELLKKIDKLLTSNIKIKINNYDILEKKFVDFLTKI